MIKHLLRNLRQKPKAARDSIAFGIAGTFTALLFVAWVYQVPDRYAEMKADQSDEDSGFAQLFTSIKDQFATVEESDQSDEVELVDVLDLEVGQSNNNLIGDDFDVVGFGQGSEVKMTTSDEGDLWASSSISGVATSTQLIKVEAGGATAIAPLDTVTLSSTDRPIRIVKVNKSSSTPASSEEMP